MLLSLMQLNHQNMHETKLVAENSSKEEGLNYLEELAKY